MKQRSATRTMTDKLPSLDLSLLRISAKRTIAERVLAHARALEMATALRRAVKKTGHAQS